MAIVVKNKNIVENIEDEKGNILGKISYNPEDLKSFQKLTSIINSINNIKNNSSNLNKLSTIQDEDITLDNFDEHKELFDGVKSDLDKINEEIEKIKNEIDEIFGEGISSIFMGNSNDLELLMPLIDDVMPKFQSRRENQVNKYLDGNDSVL